MSGIIFPNEQRPKPLVSRTKHTQGMHIDACLVLLFPALLEKRQRAKRAIRSMITTRMLEFSDLCIAISHAPDVPKQCKRYSELRQTSEKRYLSIDVVVT